MSLKKWSYIRFWRIIVNKKFLKTELHMFKREKNESDAGVVAWCRGSDEDAGRPDTADFSPLISAELLLPGGSPGSLVRGRCPVTGSVLAVSLIWQTLRPAMPYNTAPEPHLASRSLSAMGGPSRVLPTIWNAPPRFRDRDDLVGFPRRHSLVPFTPTPTPHRTMRRGWISKRWIGLQVFTVNGERKEKEEEIKVFRSFVEESLPRHQEGDEEDDRPGGTGLDKGRWRHKEDDDVIKKEMKKMSVQVDHVENMTGLDDAINYVIKRTMTPSRGQWRHKEDNDVIKRTMTPSRGQWRHKEDDDAIKRTMTS